MTEDAAARRSPRKLRAEERAARLLYEKNLVSGREVLAGDMRLAAEHRERAATISVQVGGTPRYMVKLGRRAARDSMDREILTYLAVSGTAGTTAIAPYVAHADVARGELVTEFLDPAVTLHDFHLDQPAQSYDVIDGLSDVLAHMARLPGDALTDLPEVSPWILSRDWDGRQAQIAALFPDRQMLDAVLERLEDGRRLWSPQSLIHGDLKLDNCMMIGRGGDVPAQIRLIDWELAGLGDPAWDLATLAQEYLLISDMDAGQRAGTDTASAAQEAAGVITRLITRYCRLCGMTGAEYRAMTDRTARYIGSRLVQTAYELEAIEGVDGPRTQGAIALAAWMCQAPHAFWMRPGDRVW